MLWFFFSRLTSTHFSLDVKKKNKTFYVHQLVEKRAQWHKVTNNKMPTTGSWRRICGGCYGNIRIFSSFFSYVEEYTSNKTIWFFTHLHHFFFRFLFSYRISIPSTGQSRDRDWQMRNNAIQLPRIYQLRSFPGSCFHTIVNYLV